MIQKEENQEEKAINEIIVPTETNINDDDIQESVDPLDTENLRGISTQSNHNDESQQQKTEPSQDIINNSGN